MAIILVGTSSWTDASLIECRRFYPASVRSAEDRLRYYSSQFSLVEVDSTYYSLPEERVSGLWVTRTPNDFIFDIKAFRLFTQHPTPVKVLPKDIREKMNTESRNKANIYLREFPRELATEMWNRFRKAVLPLHAAGKLGVLLFQFPPWFLPGSQNRDYLLGLKERLEGFRLAIEFRNGSWFSERNEEKTLIFLRENAFSLVCVDEPQGFKSSVPPVAEATASLALVRFHGRNRETWEKKGITATERFNYLYSDKELKEWIPKIEHLKTRAEQLHILFNNCYQDKAVMNARQMSKLLGE
jgi:uncharacterized protein YecE (DUF72 family)